MSTAIEATSFELEHSISVLQRYSPIVQALGIETRHLNALTVLGIAGTIMDDPLVLARCCHQEADRRLTLSQKYDICVLVVERLSAEEHEALRAHVKLFHGV